MKLILIVSAASAVSAVIAPVAPSRSTTLFSNDGADLTKIPTRYESAVMGRRIFALSKLATLSTIFPTTTSRQDDAGSLEQRPAGLEGLPIGLMDYVADCEGNGIPTIVALRVVTSFKNARAGSNITLSMRWMPPYMPTHRISLVSRLLSYLSFNFAKSSDTFSPPDPVSYSAANLPRFSLVGYIEDINPDVEAKRALEACFVKKHPDARLWLPGAKAVHDGEWVRLVIQQIYWIGGFGDRAYIGWIPVEEWRNVTEQEWKAVQLPGETRNWNEWHLNTEEEL